MNSDIKPVEDNPTLLNQRASARRMTGALLLLLMSHQSCVHASMFSGEALDTVADVMAWVVLVIAPIAAIAVFLMVHILPEKIAEKKKHPQTDAIKTLCLLSLFFGGMLWPLAWLWAYSKPVMYKLAYGTDKLEHDHDDAGVSVAGTSDAEELKRLRNQVSELESKLAASLPPGEKRPDMEIILLGIYSFFVWLIFFKFKWLPWNFVSQVIVITLPIVGLTMLILILNIVAPSSHDVRVINYVVPINPNVRGLVTEVPIEPNRPIKKGQVLFRIDTTPFEIAVKNGEATVRSLREQLKSTQADKATVATKLGFAKKRFSQFTELAGTGAGSKFDQEQAETDMQNLESSLAASTANEGKIQAQIASAEEQLADAKWQLSQTVYYAPADGTVVSLALRPGAMAVPLPMTPAMTFVEDEQWIMAIYAQNEVRAIKPGQEAEIALAMYPGRIIKCKVDSIMWATAQGQLPIGGSSTTAGIAPIPPNSLAVRLLVDEKDKDLFLASGARGFGAVYSDSGEMIHILRKIIIRVGAKLDWLILKLH